MTIINFALHKAVYDSWNFRDILALGVGSQKNNVAVVLFLLKCILGQEFRGSIIFKHRDNESVYI